MLYLVVGRWRVPWSFRVCPAKGTDSSALFGTKTGFMLAQIINQTLSGDDFGGYRICPLEFLHGIRKLKYHAITGVRYDRLLADGRCLKHLHKRGQQVRLVGLKFPVSVSWYYLKRDGKLAHTVCSLYQTSQSQHY